MPFELSEGPGGVPPGAGTVTYGDGSFAGYGPGGELVLGGGGGGLDAILAGAGLGGGGGDFTQTGLLGMGGGIMPIKFKAGDLLKLIRETTGVSISLAGIVALVKKVGVVMAATALGLDPGTTAKLLGAAVGKSSRRRRRGITGRQLQNAKRVNRTVGRMFRELQGTFGHRASTRTIVVNPKKR